MTSVGEIETQTDVETHPGAEEEVEPVSNHLSAIHLVLLELKLSEGLARGQRGQGIRWLT